MFDEKTYEEIMEEMLANIPDTMDKREGSIIYDAVSPCAMELAQAYVDLGMIMDECFADTASYYYLIKRAAERGIIVKEGTAAVLKIQVTPTDITIENGTEFNIGEFNYYVTENLGSGLYLITCKETGTDGNNTSDEIIPVEYIDGLETVAFGGNKADYMEKAKENSNITGCKVYPVWNGPGTVKLNILGYGYAKPEQTVIEELQELFDPTSDGTGAGLAPIGHIVTVAAVSETTVNISAGITYLDGYSFSDIESAFATAVDHYFIELNKTWEDTDNITVRTGQIESILLAITGVDDVGVITLNGSSGNLQLEKDTIPVRGTLNG